MSLLSEWYGTLASQSSKKYIRQVGWAVLNSSQVSEVMNQRSSFLAANGNHRFGFLKKHCRRSQQMSHYPRPCPTEFHRKSRRLSGPPFGTNFILQGLDTKWPWHSEIRYMCIAGCGFKRWFQTFVPYLLNVSENGVVTVFSFRSSPLTTRRVYNHKIASWSRVETALGPSSGGAMGSAAAWRYGVVCCATLLWCTTCNS